MYKVVKKLKLLKKKLRGLNSLSSHDLASEVTEDRKALKQAHQQLHRYPNNVKVQQQESKAYQNLGSHHI